MSAEVEILLGPAGSGKTTAYYEELTDAAFADQRRQFFLIVPEQAGSSAEQRLLAVNRERTGRQGFFNVDIIGFSRLAHKIFEIRDMDTREVLGEYGKTILLRAVIARVRSELALYRGSVDRQGFVDELKSLISEFLLFDILPEELEEAGKLLGEKDRQLAGKLKDVITVYRAFREDPVFREKYMVAEELQGCLAGLLNEKTALPGVDGAVFYFDGFTGFTAGQRKVIEALLPRVSKMHFTVTLDPEDGENGMFVQSREMLEQLRTISPTLSVRTLPRPERKDVLAHLERYVFRFPVREYEVKSGTDGGMLSVWKAENPLEELRVVAEDIRRSVREEDLRYRDFAILTPDVKGLGSYLDMVMREYELPYFSDMTRSFTNNPVIDAQLLALEIVDRDFAYEPVFSFLKTGILDAALEEQGTGAGAVELLENHVIAHGIRGRRLWRKPAGAFLGRRDPGEEEKASLKLVDEVRELFLDVMKPLLPFAGQKEAPIEKMIRAMQKFGGDERLRFEQRSETAEKDLDQLGYIAEARAYRGLAGKFEEVLQKTADILKDLPLSIHELRETLLAGTGELHLGVIPPTLDRVIVGDLDRTRIDGVKRLYIVNLNEGKLPRPKSEGGILNDRDRMTLNEKIRDKDLAPDEGRRRFQEQFALYLAMSKASQRLVLTCSLTSRDGSDLEPSFLLGRVLRLFPGLAAERRVRRIAGGAVRPDRMQLIRLIRKEENGSLTEEESLQKDALRDSLPEDTKLTERVPQGEETLPQELMQEMDLKISISGMEKYAECPYSYFLRYILGLRPRKEHEVKIMDVGIILHSAMEKLFREVKEKYDNDWKAVPEETVREIALKKLREAAEEQELIPPVFTDMEEDPQGDTGEEPRGKLSLILSELEEYAALSAEVLKSQLQDSRLLPEILEGGFEAEFTAARPDGSPEVVKVRGVVDRLDSFTDEDGSVFLRILDYKTSDKSLDPRDLRDGRNLQLSLYSRVLTEIFRKKKGNVIPAGMYYYHISRPVTGKLSDKKVMAKGGEEEAAKADVLQELRLNGPINISPAEDEDGGMPKHYVLELQEKGAVSEDRELRTAQSLMLTVSSGKHSVVGKPSLVDTEELLGLGEYSLYKMKTMAEELLTGQIPRRPVTVAGRRGDSCARCDCRDVCRLRTDEVHGVYVPPVADKQGLLHELAEEGNVNPVPLSYAKLYEHTSKDVLREITEESEDDRDETENGED